MVLEYIVYSYMEVKHRVGDVLCFVLIRAPVDKCCNRPWSICSGAS
jgi:hypothetical protein